jgi:protein involved in polysaccharide export with SLBB domain
MNRFVWSFPVAVALLAGAAGSRTVAAQAAGTPFQAGDRILVRVEGDSALSDTFTVVAGPALRLPEIGEISLAGVRRADIEAHLTRELARYLKDPVIDAHALIRVSVLGEVTRPGFYAVPVDLVLPDAVMLAGGATQRARVERMKILRGDSPLWSGDRLQRAIAQGATVDQLGMRAGDRIQIPGRGDPESNWRIAGLIVSIVATSVGVIAITSK